MNQRIFRRTKMSPARSRTELEEVEQAWKVLEAAGDPPADEIVTRRSPWTFRGEPMALARDGDGHRHLLIPIKVRDTFSPDTASAGVQMTDQVLLEGERRKRFIDVACRKQHLNSHFTVLVTEILEALRAPGRPDQAIHGVLERWRELLSREASAGPSLETLIGAFAELLVLSELCEGHPEAVHAWVGPDGERHDIVTPAGSVEVKGTRGRRGRQVEVHGVEQLDPPSQGELFLAYVRLESGPGGRSVLDVVAELESRGCPSTPLRAGLVKSGILPDHHEEVERRRFEVRERTTYRVDQSFPRITPASFAGGGVPGGIISLVYTLDLSSEPPAPLTAAAWDQECVRLGGSVA
jgi:hypothetical protein